MKARQLWYNGQKAVMCAEDLTQLSSEKWGTSGSVALAFEIEKDGTSGDDGYYHLIWEWGGDWTIFDENFFADKLNPANVYKNHDTDYEAEYDQAKEDAQMWKNALETAIEKAKDICPDCEDDLEWYADLARFDLEMYAEEWAELIGENEIKAKKKEE